MQYAVHRGDTEAQRIYAITEKIIGCAIEVHRALGPGLLESTYEHPGVDENSP